MIAGYWKRIRLLQKLIIMVILFLIIPVLLIGYYLFSTSLSLAQKEGREMLEEVVYQLNENIEYRIVGYQNILMQLSLDSGITTTLTQSYSSLEEEVMGLQQLNAAVNRVRSYFPMKSIQFYKTNPTLHEDGGTVLNLQRAEKEAWYSPMLDNDQSFYWYFNWKDDYSEPTLYISKWLVDYLSNEKYGFIHAEVSNRALFDQISNPLALKKGGFIVLDNKGRVLANFVNKQDGDGNARPDYLAKVYESSKGWYWATVNGSKSLVVFETNRLDWKVVTIVSQQEIWQKLQLVKKAAVTVSILFVVLTVGVLTGFGIRTTNRLNSLIRSMRRVRSGDLGLTIKVHSKDELADLEEEFNAMSLRLEQSLGEIAEARSRVEIEKLNLLQAQINPHFLYNTLALVKSMAMDVGSSEISSTVDALAKFFRLALNRGTDILPFSDEMDHVKAYLEIHKSRYPGRITVQFDVDEETYSCSIIKITLQPIVENALLHAFVHTGGRGCLTIAASMRQDRLCITIADNGSGMSEEQLHRLLENAQGDRVGGGFGVYNVNERLKRYYGPNSQMLIQSKPGEGTIVQLVIPQNQMSNQAIS
ncbi:sensor histidine kinase [Paenibacillus glycanilyticus]|uniref:histidine kinase n=1 Tax=Paenibacillus glycanilyticus TaxID=126569 RepID=A0ABQ6GCB8_9BACL|nr:histidine kinase [Paenibacillus glycanilyticus]GLX66712.1 histidine kinase [Paenibacillus glycanilyticus]